MRSWKMTSTTTQSPTPTLTTIPCPPELKKFYCLNNSDCFVIKIEDTLIYNCECPHGYMGQRCEFKNLEQSYLRQRYETMLQQASLTSVFILLILLLALFILYLYYRRGKQRQANRTTTCPSPEYREVGTEDEDGGGGGGGGGGGIERRAEKVLNIPFNKQSKTTSTKSNLFS